MGRTETRTVRLRDGVEVEVRTAEPGDAAGILDHLLDVARTSDHGVTQPDEMTTTTQEMAERIDEYASAPGSLMLVAVHAGLVVGEIAFKAHNRRRMAHHGHFGIGLRSGWRARGLGTHLVGALLDWARAHETVEKVCLGVFATNRHAIALYQKMGFVEEGRRNREFKLGPGRYEDDIQMSIWVKPPEDAQAASR